jgi:hypothetical protein
LQFGNKESKVLRNPLREREREREEHQNPRQVERRRKKIWVYSIFYLEERSACDGLAWVWPMIAA